MEFDPERQFSGGGGTNGKLIRRIEHFWLCGNCAAMLTLAIKEGQVVALPIHSPQAIKRAAAS